MTTKRAILYGRVSGDDARATGGANLQAQIDLCREYAQRQGYVIVAELKEDDRGASGATFDLPQLSKALDLARQGAFDVLIARELDRLARDLAKQMIVEQELKRSGVVIEYALYDFPDTPEGRLNKNLRAMLAEYEREKIAQRMMRGKLRKIKEGNTMTHGRPPYGYAETVSEADKHALEIDGPEAQVVKMIYNLYTEERLSVRQVALQLDALGVQTYAQRRADPATQAIRQAKDNPPPVVWQWKTVLNILSNEAYCGVWRYTRKGEEGIVVNIPAIIARVQWEAAQERRRDNARTAKRNTRHFYLMQYRLTCADCGYKLRTAARGGERRYYYCQSNEQRIPCHNRAYYRADQIDAAMWQWIVERFENEEALYKAMLERKAAREKEVTPLRARLEAVAEVLRDNQAARERVRQLYYNGHIKMDELVRDSKPYESAIAGALAEQSRIMAQIETQTLTEERIQTVLELRRYVWKGIEEARDNPNLRKRVVEVLNVIGKVGTSDGQTKIEVYCEVTDEVAYLSIAGKDKLCIAHNRHTSFILSGVIILPKRPRQARDPGKPVALHSLHCIPQLAQWQPTATQTATA